jgi:hypothetical protein
MTRHFYDQKTGRHFEADVRADERKVSIAYTPLDGTQQAVQFLLGIDFADVCTVVAKTIACDEARMIHDRTGIEIDSKTFVDMNRRAHARLADIT